MSRDRRYVPPGSCKWCGHPPHHFGVCPKQIRVGEHKGKAVNEPCPCAWVAA